MQSVPAAPRWLATDRRSRSWLLLAAILPAIFFLGHWPALQVDIPGTNTYVAVPFFGHDGQSVDGASDAHEEEHEQHCHANAATCSDIPFTGVSAFALMVGVVAGLHHAAASILMFAVPGALLIGATLIPELRPPNRFA